MGRNVNSRMPRDPDNGPIQVLTPSTIVNAALGGASSTTALPAGAEIVEIGASEDAFIVFGDALTTVSLTDGMFFAKGAAVYKVPDGATHLAHIAATLNGRITITLLR